VRLHHHPEDGMDIKKLFDFVPTEQKVNKFFLTLKLKTKVFASFIDLPDFTDFMYGSAGKNFDLKDACLLAIIGGIQTANDKAPGLNLITYLLAPGLQNILKKSLSGGSDIREEWLALWSEFFQIIQRYSLANRPHKVAANLLFDTYHRIKDLKENQQDWMRRIEPVEGHELKTNEEELSSDFRLASALLQGEDDAGLNKIDLDLVISSRVYGEPMKSLAQRLGLNYHNALKRRSRAEDNLRRYWRLKIDTD
jgi:hypothetical protein